MRMSARGASVPSQRPPVPDAEAENSCSSRKRPCRKRRGKRASLRPYGYREGGRVWESRSCATERAVHGHDVPRPATQRAGRGPSGDKKRRKVHRLPPVTAACRKSATPSCRQSPNSAAAPDPAWRRVPLPRRTRACSFLPYRNSWRTGPHESSGRWPRLPAPCPEARCFP